VEIARNQMTDQEMRKLNRQSGGRRFSDPVWIHKNQCRQTRCAGCRQLFNGRGGMEVALRRRGHRQPKDPRRREATSMGLCEANESSTPSPGHQRSHPHSGVNPSQEKSARLYIYSANTLLFEGWNDVRTGGNCR
jgi:hypothetical protein